jgi:hypothetical protein
MFKIISHAVIFLAGAGAGVYWGVHHPTQAASLSDMEAAKAQQAIAQAKLEVLQQVGPNQPPPPPGTTPAAAAASTQNKYQQLLQTAQQELNAAKSKLGNQ